MEPSNTKNLLLRTLSYLVLAPISLFLLWKGGMYANTLVGVAFGLVAYEWIKLIIASNFSLNLKWIWFILGYTYFAVAFITFKLLLTATDGNYMLMIIAALVWASDTGGYIFGKLFKGPKLASRISPNKTWSGSLGGFILTGFIAWIIFRATNEFFPLLDVLVSIAVPISLVAQLGDLAESWAKRQFNVKDTGKLIPGHGGALDRLDGLIAVGFVLGLLKLFDLGNLMSPFTK